jgi:hypothetical protein
MLKRKALFVGRIRKDFHYRNKMKYDPPPPKPLGRDKNSLPISLTSDTMKANEIEPASHNRCLKTPSESYFIWESMTGEYEIRKPLSQV